MNAADVTATLRAGLAPNGVTFHPLRATRSSSAHGYAVRWWGEFVGTVDTPRYTGLGEWSFCRAGADWVPLASRALYPTRGAAAAGLLRDAGLLRAAPRYSLGLPDEAPR